MILFPRELKSRHLCTFKHEEAISLLLYCCMYNILVPEHPERLAVRGAVRGLRSALTGGRAARGNPRQAGSRARFRPLTQVLFLTNGFLGKIFLACLSRRQVNPPTGVLSRRISGLCRGWDGAGSAQGQQEQRTAGGDPQSR
ncbi:uncharacterized protein GJ701_003036 [Geothlypis trichas]